MAKLVSGTRIYGTANVDVQINIGNTSTGASIVANTTTIAFGNTVNITANGAAGGVGQVLTSNGTTVIWTSPFATAYSLKSISF
jgi:hypothetical protein